jgi:hypothetical protein
MRLQTAEQRAAYRAAMTPKNAVKDARSNELGEVYVYTAAEALYAVAFRGTAGRPSWHYRFRTEAQREKSIADFLATLQGWAEYKSERRAAVKAFQHDVKVGDVFRSSWGYDQTNIDYYQVVRLIGKHMAEVRAIQQEVQETAWAQGECVPVLGKWATEADYSDAGKAFHATHGHYPSKPKASFRVRIQAGPSFKVSSCAHASRMTPVSELGGIKVYAASHWTAYA